MKREKYVIAGKRTTKAHTNKVRMCKLTSATGGKGKLAVLRSPPANAPAELRPQASRAAACRGSSMEKSNELIILVLS